MSPVLAPSVDHLADEEWEAEHQLALERGRSSMLGFVRHVNPRYEINWHHAVMCRLIDQMIAGDIKRLIISAPPRHGKALAVDTPIATPTGFKAMGKLVVGDTVFDENGSPCRIVAVTKPQANRPVYLVRAKDGGSVVADAEHEWVVRLCRKGKAVSRRTTSDLEKRQESPSWRAPAIAIQGALQTEEVALPIDPYVLGVWLGDGCSGHATITAAPDEAKFFRLQFEARGYKTVDRSTKLTFGVVGGLWRSLLNVGLAKNKHVPTAYLFASPRQRLELLQGLVDADGHVAPDGQTEFCSTQKELAEAVLFLVNSLGQKASIHEGRATLNGRYIGQKYRVLFYLKDCALLPRKRQLTRSSVRFNHRYVRVTPQGTAETRCIQVDAPSGMFLAGLSLLPTHNSEICSRAMPAYIFGRDPDAHIIATSYGAELAQRMNRDCQRIIDSPEYAELFPQTQLYGSNVRTVAKGSYLRNSDIFEVVGHRGQYRCAGTGGPITGSGGHWLIADDLIRNDEDASSTTILDKQWEWYVGTFRTRLATGGRILIVMTRWTDADIPGRLIELAKTDPLADQWHVVNLPAINEGGPTDIDPRQPGEALWPAWFPLKDLLAQKAAGSRAFQAMYQGDPVPPGGNIVQASWFRRYRQGELPRRWERIIIACDLTFDDKKSGDWNVFAVLGKANGNVYLLDLVRRQMGFIEQCERLMTLHDKWSPGVRETLVEKAANGTAMVAVLKSRIPGVIAVPPGDKSKVSRANAVTHVIESGNFLVPHTDECAWIEDYLIEWCRFPHGKNDDRVDCTVLGLSRLMPPKRQLSFVAPVGFSKASILARA